MKIFHRPWLGSVVLVCSMALTSRAQSTRPTAATRTMPPAGVPAGRFETVTLFDSTYRRDRRIWIYTPAGYQVTGRAGYDLILAFDGDGYRETIPLPLMLDTLFAGRHTPPFVAVMVDDSSSTVRLAELANQARFARFLAVQLVPWVRRHYNVTHDPHRTIVAGSSAGGLAAAYFALLHPELAGNVLVQSGAFWRGNNGVNGAPYEWLSTQFGSMKRLDVRFFLDVGSRETGRPLGGTGPTFIDASRRFRDVLLGKGYRVAYAEVPNGTHTPESWRRRTPIGIATLAAPWRSR